MDNTQFQLFSIVRARSGEYRVIAKNTDGRRISSMPFKHYSRMRETFAANGLQIPLKKDLLWVPVCGHPGARYATL